MASDTTSSEQPFKLSVPDADLNALRSKLALTRFPDELEGAGWDYGVPLADMKRLVGHWKDAFDWRAAEVAINQLPMFTQDIVVEGFGTLNVHYVHQKSEVKNAIPLLLVHGWPGHFLEVRKMLPLLTAASTEHPSFHVVAVGLPGFGFSEAPKKPGFAGPQYAELFNKLMCSVGYEEYVYQGGDWGHILGAHAAANYGHKHLQAWHSNLPLSLRPTLFSHPLAFLRSLLPCDAWTRKGLEATAKYVTKGSGYFVEQATKPQTVGYSLADSPVGVLSWIYEKLVECTDEYPWTDDEVLEWVSVYWFSRAGPAASVRIYYEMTGGNSKDAMHLMKDAKWTSVPLGLSYFPAEIIRLPKPWAHTLGKVVLQSVHEKGGHFAAHEQPGALAGDLRKMFGKGGPAYGVVSGKDGYA
ncbi:alpha/beta-hydrolase [Pilatotrama ljubarskyi]|nr:alpha/beta-hydrolase [Pilatotrama ljubarskyi]